MSLAQALSIYLLLNILVTIAFVGLLFFDRLVRENQIVASAGSELWLHYAALTFVFIVVIVQPFIPTHSTFHTVAKVWSAESIKQFYRQRVQPGGFLALSMPHASLVIAANQIKLIWEVIATLVLGFGGLKLSLDLRQLNRIKRHSYVIRKIRRVSLLVSDEIQVPFSYRFFGAKVVIPSALLSRPAQLRIAVMHELQHHRQKDTLWVYGIWLLRLFCAPNPFVHLWSRLLTEKQEFACDETLVDQKRVKSQTYASCLVEVAQTVVSPIRTPVCATGLTFLTNPNLLKRRITKMLTQTPTQKGWSIIGVFFVAISLTMAATVYASKSLVQDERVTLAQARKMAQAVSTDQFPIVVNSDVVRELNRYLATPDGREFIKSALARMQSYAPIVRVYTAKYNVPPELMAVPLVESGYQNLTQAQSDTPQHAAGLWQFIPKTARDFGLVVNSDHDQRINVDAETSAAMRLLESNYLRFNDWQLSVLAYNAGDKVVQTGIDNSGSRDAWTLIHDGYQGDAGYLARVMAAVLIMNNPTSIR